MKTLTLSVNKLSGEKLKDFQQIKEKARVNDRLHLIAYLSHIFPLCFNMKAPKPLKLDIEADILARLPADHTVSKKKLQRALKYYVLNIAYKTALIKDVFRYDLDGNPSGPVELEHKDDAKRWIEGVLEVRRVAKAARDAARKMRPQRDPSKPRRDEDGSPRPGSGQRLRSPYSTGRPRQD